MLGPSVAPCDGLGATFHRTEYQYFQFLYATGTLSKRNLRGFWKIRIERVFFFRPRDGASYKYEHGVTALYLNGSGAYADVSAISLPAPTFSITCWVKVLEPAKTPGYVFADWSSPQKFAIWVHGDLNAVFFQLRTTTGGDLLTMDTS